MSEPRTWALPEEPPVGTKVRGNNGLILTRIDMPPEARSFHWVFDVEGHTYDYDWADALGVFGPLTEVLGDE